MADCQYADIPRAGSRFYRESTGKLEAAIGRLNREELAFTIHAGDFIDRDFRSFDVLDPIAAKLKSPLRHVLGNHDFDVADTEKPEVPGRLGLDRGYYSWVERGFRFVVLDTNEVSTYRHPEKARETRRGEAALAAAVASKAAGAKPWNGQPGEEQMAWLDQELRDAGEAGENAIVIGHHPILPTEGHAIWNAPVLADLLGKHTAAKVYLNGHNHAGAYADADGLHFLTLRGMVETQSENAFAVVSVFPGQLAVEGFDRQESHDLKFR